MLKIPAETPYLASCRKRALIKSHRMILRTSYISVRTARNNDPVRYELIPPLATAFRRKKLRCSDATTFLSWTHT
jgi:hypothetical protein